MKLVVISPEADDTRELSVLVGLFSAGLQRYHMRKPSWTRPKLQGWLRTLPPEWRARVVLHQHHDLVPELGLGGVHFRATEEGLPECEATADETPSLPYRPVTSRSCHDVASLRAALGRYDAAFFSPVFPSISKPGHAPRADLATTLTPLLVNRTARERRTAVIALSGVSAGNAPRALELGFDGVAALGAIWQAPDPVRAFTRLQESLACHAA